MAIRKVALISLGLALGGLLLPPGVAVAKQLQDVLITNTPEHPVPTVEQTVPFELTTTVFIEDGQRSGFENLPLPEGKRLVITHFSGTANVDPDNTLRSAFVRSVTPANDLGGDYFAFPQQGEQEDIDTIRWRWTQPMTVHVEAGSFLHLAVTRSGTTSEDAATLSVTGYLVDLQS